MPWRLTNGVNTVQNVMNEVFHEFLDQGVLVYLQYSGSQDEPEMLVLNALLQLQEQGLTVLQ